MGAFSGLYGATPSFSFTPPSALEGTGSPVSSDLPSWAQTGLGIFSGAAGVATNLLSAVNQLRGNSSDRAGRLSDDYEADKEARERESYSVPAKLPSWLILAGLVVVGVVVYQLKD